LPPLAQEILAAADKGDWKSFTQKMGGVFSKRTEQVFKPYYALSFDTDTGVIKTTLYCANELVRALKGVTIVGQDIVTRIHKWRIEHRECHAFNLEFCE
jgi:hypothetical protein